MWSGGDVGELFEAETLDDGFGDPYQKLCVFLLNLVKELVKMNFGDYFTFINVAIGFVAFILLLG